MKPVITPEMEKAGNDAARKWFNPANWGGDNSAIGLAKAIYEAMHKASVPTIYMVETDLSEAEINRLLDARPSQIVRLPPEHNRDDIALIRELVKLYDQNTCTHEQTYRGGAIWTICSQCDRKWADDKGGFVPYVDPPAIEQARALLVERL